MAVVLGLLAACARDGAGVVPLQSAATGSTVPDVVAHQPLLLPPAGLFDYQLGGDYPPAAGVEVITRDWFSGRPAAGLYNICYVNAFQTQPAEGDARPDAREGWPARVVSTFEDPDWPGEFVIDLGTLEQRAAAAGFVRGMVDTCREKGFDAVEFDNLDTYSRVADLPFGQPETLEYAATITAFAHTLGLAVGQKNTVELTRDQAIGEVGFDFAVVEECAEYDECGAYRAIYGVHLFAIEYSEEGMMKACSDLGVGMPVLLRDRDLRTPTEPGYQFRTFCGDPGDG